MSYKYNRTVPDLEIPDFKKYIDYDDDTDIERLLVPADILLDLVEADDNVLENATERFLTDTYIDDGMKRGFVDDLDLKLQPEVWKMNASDFKRYLCEILELNYHTSQREILEVIREKMEGLR